LTHPHPHPQHHNGTKNKILGLPINSGHIFDVTKKNFIDGDEIQKLFKMLALKKS
jgi:hypothetical protein